MYCRFNDMKKKMDAELNGITATSGSNGTAQSTPKRKQASAGNDDGDGGIPAKKIKTRSNAKASRVKKEETARYSSVTSDEVHQSVEASETKGVYNQDGFFSDDDYTM